MISKYVKKDFGDVAISEVLSFKSEKEFVDVYYHRLQLRNKSNLKADLKAMYQEAKKIRKQFENDPTISE